MDMSAGPMGDWTNSDISIAGTTFSYHLSVLVDNS